MAKWKNIPGFSRYKVSDTGIVKSIDSYILYSNGVKHFYKGKKLKPFIDPDGYESVSLRSDEKKSKTFFIHVLVLTSFVGSRPKNKPHCRHLDGNSRNNVIGNLKWGTVKRNHEDREKHGKTARGDFHGKAIKTNVEIKKLKLDIKKGLSNNEIMSKYNVTRSYVHDIRHERSWSHIKV